ncbi:MerR family DNA-binding transcriptional regulator [Pseudonocardia sp. S2-4]|uniref:MerR family DNA-binding transcriptional regulator n=1 Tax=Pseudonocardia humida TaxID=2800819 RepID=A0ABT0ZTW5_9PSEU|nr:MerR family DNA-binding transcriptional regulator [Pseudonocardia humida]
MPEGQGCGTGPSCTGELARALGITARTLQRYRREGLITPASETVSGRARWVEEDVREQIRKARQDYRPPQRDKDGAE